MSDNIPFDIQAEIIKRLPIKSLLQFRSVSIPWKSLIDSSRFIADYSTQVPLLLVRCGDRVNHEHKYVSVVDDDTFPQQKVDLTVPQFVKMLKDISILGRSYGLLCLYSRGYHNGLGKDVTVLWNISIRKAIAVVGPDVPNEMIFRTVVGFGVCRQTNDPKIVKITQINGWRRTESISCIPWQVEVFTLRTRAWRSSCGNLPRKSIDFEPYDVVAMDGVFYWLATDMATMDGAYQLIVSFDVTSEEFREITLPDSSVRPPHLVLSLSKLKGSNVVIEYDEWAMSDLVVWMMMDGVPTSFTNLFTITSNIFACNGISKEW